MDLTLAGRPWQTHLLREARRVLPTASMGLGGAGGTWERGCKGFVCMARLHVGLRVGPTWYTYLDLSGLGHFDPVQVAVMRARM